MAISTCVSIAQLMRDLYLMPGERIKQWVVDQRREAAWERDTCPKVSTPEHDDNTGIGCRNVGDTQWSYLEKHDCCYFCNELAGELSDRADVSAWVTARSARPAVNEDRDKLSNEVEPDAGPLRLPEWMGAFK